MTTTSHEDQFAQDPTMPAPLDAPWAPRIEEDADRLDPDSGEESSAASPIISKAYQAALDAGWTPPGGIPAGWHFKIKTDPLLGSFVSITGPAPRQSERVKLTSEAVYHCTSPNLHDLLARVAQHQEDAGGSSDDVDWLEKGIAEWRSAALASSKQAEAARATARIAIGHLQAVLALNKTHTERQDADTAARLWLQSIGAD